MKKILALVFALFILVANFTFVTNAADFTPIGGGASTNYVGASSLTNNLELFSGGRLTCTATTTAKGGYTSETIVELQQNGKAIKSWSYKSSTTYSYVVQDWYVASGYLYQLKTTHKVYSGSTCIETLTNYSDPIYY